MPEWTEAELRAELARAEAATWWKPFVASVKRHGLELAWMAGIASRETNFWPKDGDGGHGRGLLQVDDRWHPIINGKSIGRCSQSELINAGCGIAADYLQQVAHAHPDWPPDDQLKVAASAYNCGVRNALDGSAEGDSDLRTTGRDYGRDVMARRKLFAQWLR